MFPAVQALKKSKKVIVAALSNTVIFPPDHEYSKTPESTENVLRTQFDVFVSSAHVGLRKPHREIYELAVKMCDEHDRKNGGSGVKASDIVFLDDIGENCKMGRAVGFRTIRVMLGHTDKAVRELEEIVGLDLGSKNAKL
jgi:FMN phosphatase YigB (HAD superfamily)